jgi:hypothetical protein
MECLKSMGCPYPHKERHMSAALAMMHADHIRIRGADASERRCSIEPDSYPNSIQLFLHMPGWSWRAMTCTCSPARSTLAIKRHAGRRSDEFRSLAFFVIGWQPSWVSMSPNRRRRVPAGMSCYTRSGSCCRSHRKSAHLVYRIHACTSEVRQSVLPCQLSAHIDSCLAGIQALRSCRPLWRCVVNEAGASA